MLFSPNVRVFLLCFFCLTVLFSNFAFAFGDDWKPITPEELALKKPKVEADADAEAIFWEVRVDDSSNSSNLVMNHYIRVKIFTERGREKYSKIDIPYTQDIRIKNVMARVIKPDGSIVPLNKNDIFEREIAKANKIKIKAKSFAIPNIETGVIVEYRYQEIHENAWAQNMRMVFQHDIPIENITYYFRPANNLKYLSFNMKESKFIKDKNGFYRAGMENVPALKEEPQMPPEDEVRSWLIIDYTNNLKDEALDFWARVGGLLAYSWEIKDTLKPSKDLKAAATEITAGATSDVEKVSKIYNFCKTKIKNITYDTQLTDEQKADIKPNKSTTDTYKKLQGTSRDINELFASLITAAGLESRLTFGGDRSEKFFNPQQSHIAFIHFSAIAVRVNERWRYFDPGSYYTPFGMLPWYEEGTSVLLLNNKDFITTETQLSSVDKSMAKRSGNFKLLEDGTLEGNVKVEYTGHLSSERKINNYKDSDNKREETLKDEIKKQMSTAEISNISIENVNDPEKPFIYNYKVRVPNYAQKTGKRIFLQPGFFEYGIAPLFTTESRKYDIAFQYPWSESDHIEIELPKGYSLDNAESPGQIKDPQGISQLNTKIKLISDKEENKLVYDRNFYFGDGGNILFPVTAYKPVKNMFDLFQKSDSHTITLKQN